MRSLFLTFFFATLCALAFLQGNQRPPERPAATYTNCDFGYSVKVPVDIAAGSSPYSRHGFRIVLPDGKSAIEIYNSFNMGEGKSFPDIVTHQIELRSQGKANWKTMSQTFDQVHGFPSAEVTASYAGKTERWRVKTLVVYRPIQANGLGNIVYILELSSPEALYDRALPKLNEIINGFQFTDLPLAPCSNVQPAHARIAR